MSPTLKKILVNLLYLALAGVVFFYLGREVHSHWRMIRSYEFNFDWPLLLLASGAYCITFFVLAVGWWLLLNDLRHPVKFLDAFVYFCITQPCKYVPGKIWVPVARSKLCKQYGVSTSVCFLSTGLEGIMEILAGTYISLFAIITSPDFGQGAKIGSYIFVALGLLLLIPKVYYAAVNTYLRLTKQPLIEKAHRVGFKKLFTLQVVYGIGMLMMGASQVMFLRAFTFIPTSAIPFLISVGTFSYVASILAFFSPSGLGVREGVWYAALKGIVVEHVGLIFALISRLWTVVIEALLAFISLSVFFLLRRNGEENSEERQMAK